MSHTVVRPTTVLCKMRWEQRGERGTWREAKKDLTAEGKFAQDQVKRTALLVERRAGAKP